MKLQFIQLILPINKLRVNLPRRAYGRPVCCALELVYSHRLTPPFDPNLTQGAEFEILTDLLVSALGYQDAAGVGHTLHP